MNNSATPTTISINMKNSTNTAGSSFVERSIFLTIDLCIHHFYPLPMELHAIIKSYLYIAITTDNIHNALETIWRPHIDKADHLYKEALLTYGRISYWDTSQVTDMSQLFAYHYVPGDTPDSDDRLINCYIPFNEPLQAWDTSNVTSMFEMFYGCKYFNQHIDSWDVSKVTDMTSMFRLCHRFNQSLVNWNVGNVTTTRYMFQQCYQFNQPLITWNVSNVADMVGMFSECSEFNQPLDQWQVGKVKNMASMFLYAFKFNQDLTTWNVRNVTMAANIFYGAKAMNRSLVPWSEDEQNQKDYLKYIFGRITS